MLQKNIIILLLLLLTGCAAAPLPPVAITPGKEIETLQGPVSFVLATKNGTMGGQGLLFYRKPGQFRLSALAPFGQIVMDVIVSGNDITCILPMQKKGWQGVMADLPESFGAGVWPLLAWVVESPPPAGPALERGFTRADGTREKVQFTAGGLVQKKRNASGDEVSYDDYRLADGVAMAHVIEITTRDGKRLKLTFDEPELNRPLADEIMTPALGGVTMLPLAELGGFEQ